MLHDVKRNGFCVSWFAFSAVLNLHETTFAKICFFHNYPASYANTRQTAFLPDVLRPAK